MFVFQTQLAKRYQDDQARKQSDNEIVPMFVGPSNEHKDELQNRMSNLIAHVGNKVGDNHIFDNMVPGMKTSKLFESTVNSVLDTDHLLLSKKGEYLSVRVPIGPDSKFLVTTAATKDFAMVAFSTTDGNIAAFAKVSGNELTLYRKQNEFQKQQMA